LKETVKGFCRGQVGQSNKCMVNLSEHEAKIQLKIYEAVKQRETEQSGNISYQQPYRLP